MSAIAPAAGALTPREMLGLRDVRGQVLRQSIHLGELADGTPVLAPVTIICGNQPGPTLWIQAAIHGSETGGLIAILRLIEQLSPTDLAGQLILVPVVNPMAFRAQSRTTPFDHVNMNRAFPGARDGTFTEQACSRIYELVSAGADYVVDLHSGGAQAIVPHYGIYHDSDSDASQTARELVLRLGVDLVWRSSEAWLSGALLTVATHAGIPSLIIESGGGSVDERQVGTFTSSLMQLMRALGMLPGPTPDPLPPRLEVSGCTFIQCTRGGMYMPEARAGDVLQAGDVIGRIVDLYGQTVEEITVPHGPVCLMAVPAPFVPVETGQMIAEAVSVVRDLGEAQG